MEGKPRYAVPDQPITGVEPKKETKCKECQPETGSCGGKCCTEA